MTDTTQTLCPQCLSVLDAEVIEGEAVPLVELPDHDALDGERCVLAGTQGRPIATDRATQLRMTKIHGMLTDPYVMEGLALGAIHHSVAADRLDMALSEHWVGKEGDDMAAMRTALEALVHGAVAGRVGATNVVDPDEIPEAVLRSALVSMLRTFQLITAFNAQHPAVAHMAQSGLMPEPTPEHLAAYDTMLEMMIADIQNEPEGFFAVIREGMRHPAAIPQLYGDKS